MNLIRNIVKKSKLAAVFVFIFLLLLNFCSIDAFAFPYEGERYQEAVTEGHGHSHGGTHSEDSANSHGDEEDPFCCSTIKAIGVSLQKIVSSNNLEESSRFSYYSQFAFIEKEFQILLVWGSTRNSGPPGSILFKSIFLKATPSHAPPVAYSI